MTKKRVLCVFGTRPEAIKMAPVVLAIAQSEKLEGRVCVTGQHREMLDQVLELFDIVPDFDLALMKPNQNLCSLMANALTGLSDVFEQWRPDVVVVQGDTTTALAGAMAAHYHQISVAHVEAGLRSGDLMAPWPEEMNRKAIGVMTQLHFPPTERAARSLKSEGVAPETVFVTGNTVIDALVQVVAKIDNDDALKRSLAEQLSFVDASRRLILVTGHRRENFGEGMESFCRALAQLAERPDVQIVYPVHLNPNVQEPVKRILGAFDNIVLVEPQSYLPFVELMRRATLIISDSGGVQEEAPSLGKPVLVTRDKTERPEAVEAGTVMLVGTDQETIVREATRLLDDEEAWAQMSRQHNPYGDGKAAPRIVREIERAS